MNENARERNVENEGIRITNRMEEAVDRGVDAAERIHRRLAAIPLDLIAPIDDVEAAVNDLRRIQSRALDVVYGVARDINHEVAGLAKEWIGVITPEPKAAKKRTTKKRTPATKGRTSVRAA